MKRLVLPLLLSLACAAGWFILDRLPEPSPSLPPAVKTGLNPPQDTPQSPGEILPKTALPQSPTHSKKPPPVSKTERTWLEALGSLDPAERKAAADKIRAIPWPRRLDVLRWGLANLKGRAAAGCAVALDWKYLDSDELERQADAVAPHIRSIYDWLDDIDSLCLDQDDCGFESLRHGMGFDAVTRLLRTFPGPPASGHDAMQGIFNPLHRSMRAEHIPLLVKLTEREGDPLLVTQAFWAALFLSQYTHRFCEEIAGMLLRLDPRESRAEKETNPYGFAPDPGAPFLAPKPGLPPAFIACIERVEPALGGLSAGSGETSRSVHKFRCRWARQLTPDAIDLPLLRKMASAECGFLRLWAMRKLGGFVDKKSDDLLQTLMAEGQSALVRALAASGLARRGDAMGGAVLARLAHHGSAVALVLLHEVTPAGFDRALPVYLQKAEDPTMLPQMARALHLLFGIALPERLLNRGGALLLAQRGGGMEVIWYFRELRGGEKWQAAERTLKKLQQAESADDRWGCASSFPLFEAWAPEAFHEFLQEVSGPPDPDQNARWQEEMDRYLSQTGEVEPAEKDMATWRAQVEERHRGAYWIGLYRLAQAGDEKARVLFRQALDRGHYGVWKEEDVDVRVRDLAWVPFLVHMMESNCCAKVFVDSAWEELFGFESEDLETGEPDLDEACSPAERLSHWWRTFGDRLVRVKAAGIYVVKSGD